MKNEKDPIGNRRRFTRDEYARIQGILCAGYSFEQAVKIIHQENLFLNFKTTHCSNCGWVYKYENLHCLCALYCHLEDSDNHVRSGDCLYCKNLIKNLYLDCRSKQK